MFKIYAEVLEQGALDQFNEAIAQPFVTSGSLMPDAHQGYSLPIGAVVAVKDMVIPSYVGFDLGCGMCALKLEGIDKDEVITNAKGIFDEIYRTIPVGFHINDTAHSTISWVDELTPAGQEIAKKKNYQRAIGSLGGGNHFIEIGHDENDEVWVVIHSGSRGVGHGIATHYMKLAHPEGKAKDGHHGFHVETQEGQDYIQDMNWALDFALANRQEMMQRIVNAITLELDITCYEADFSELINRNHNHAVLTQTKQGERWIHRKGATQAEKGMMGVIPGNMKDGSFIVRGKGCEEALYSSSHGAGRVLGRKAAKKALNVEDFIEDMKGIQALVGDKTLDESRLAYKNIFDVMKLQEDLVEVVAHIKPLINIKG